MRKNVIILLLCVQSICAQVTFEATTKTQSVALNERLRVDFVVNADADNFLPPTFEGFEIIAGPYMKYSTTFLNGNQTHSKSYSYFVKADKLGKFTVGPASINVDGKTYTTLPLDVTVMEAVTNPKEPTPIKLFGEKK